jgi:hypothetical protein
MHDVIHHNLLLIFTLVTPMPSILARRKNGLCPKSILFEGLINMIESAIKVDDEFLLNRVIIENDYQYVLNRTIKLCPDLVEYLDDEGNSILHIVCEKYIQHCLGLKLFKVLAEAFPKYIFYHKNHNGMTPVDNAILFSTIEAVKVIMEFTPSNQSLLNPFNNIVRAFYRRGNKQQVLDKMTYFLHRHKDYVRMRCQKAYITPLHACLEISECSSDMTEKFFYIPLLLIRQDPSCCRDVRKIVNSKPCGNDSRLPLMTLIHRFDFNEDFRNSRWTTMSKFYELFQTILNAYPACANIKTYSSKPSDRGISTTGTLRVLRTPYEYAVRFKLKEEYRRLLLNACPEIDPVTMKMYNWKARKHVLLLSYLSLTGTDYNILVALRSFCPDVFKKVVFYF